LNGLITASIFFMPVSSQTPRSRFRMQAGALQLATRWAWHRLFVVHLNIQGTGATPGAVPANRKQAVLF
jgi:hypothetical protein